MVKDSAAEEKEPAILTDDAYWKLIDKLENYQRKIKRRRDNMPDLKIVRDK